MGYFISILIILFPIVVLLISRKIYAQNNLRFSKISFKDLIEEPLRKSNIVVADIKNVENFRDIGGLSTESGKIIKPGVIFRSGNLHNLREEDYHILSSLRISSICDLRSDFDAKRYPDSYPTDINYKRIPLYSKLNLYSDPKNLSCDYNKLIEEIGNRYKETIDTRKKSIKKLYSYLLELEEYPVLIHCTSGKDQTVIAIALLLYLLGVPYKTVVAEYSLSNYASEIHYTKIKELYNNKPKINNSIDLQKIYLMAYPKWISDTLDYIDKKYNGIEEYFISALGFSHEDINKLKSKLLI